MSYTRKDIRQRIGGAGFCNDMVVSATTGAGTTATFVDANRIEVDDTFINCQVVFLTGTYAGQRRLITDWVQSTGTGTFAPVLAGAPGSAVDYEIHRLYPADDKDEAINEALHMAGTRWPVRCEDASLSVSSGVYTYSLSGLLNSVDPEIGIDKLEYSNGSLLTGYPYDRLGDDWWDVRNSGGALTIQFYRLPRVGSPLRLTYRQRPPTLLTDAALLSPNIDNLYNYVVAKATALLMDDRARRANATQKESLQVDAAKLHNIAESFMNADRPQPAPGRVRFPITGETNRGDI